MRAGLYTRPVRKPDGSYGLPDPVAELELSEVGGEQPEVVVYGGRYFTRWTLTHYHEATALVLEPGARPVSDAPGGSKPGGGS